VKSTLAGLVGALQLQDDIDNRHQTIKRFQVACQQDDRFLAAFVGGSFASGAVDEFSDLDLYAIIASEAYDQFLVDHREFFEGFSEPVFLEHFDGFGFDMYVFILADGTQGELALAEPEQFTHIHGGPYKVLVDKPGLLEDVDFPWQKPTSSQQLDQLRKHLDWFWRDLSLFSVAMGRGRHWTAFGYLQSMRLRCIHLLRIDKDFSSWSNGYEKVEAAVGKQALQQLLKTLAKLETKQMLSAVETLVALYRRVALRLTEQYSIPYPHAAERVVLNELARATGLVIG
jgi:hypothetical protein